MARSARSHRGVPPRKRIWARETGSVTLAASANNSVDLMADFKTAYGANAVLGGTVARIRGEIGIYPSATLDTVASWAVGIIVAPVGFAGDPITEPDADWMYYKRRGYKVIFKATGNAVTTSQSNPFLWELDVKSMRKLEELQQQLYLVFSNGAGSATNIFYDASTLILLP